VRFVIYEFITGGGLFPKALPPSLQREGELMLQAVLQDALELPSFEVAILRDPRLFTLTVHTLSDWKTALAWGEIFLIIAPEMGRCLWELQREVLQAGKILWGCGLEAVQCCSYKSLTETRLAAHNIAHIPCYFPQQKLPRNMQKFVIKPNDGAGCGDTFLATRRQLSNLSQQILNPIIQPYVVGENLSVCVLYGQRQSRVVAVNRQLICIENAKFSYHGSEVNAFPALIPKAQLLAVQIGLAIPDLWGWVGIDIILHKQQWVVTEINPRLTTSYVGLRQSLNQNPLSLLQNRGLDFLELKLKSHLVKVIVS
jgi:predicted ATP-grasp superfamily ATP-dependent carboligase